MCYLECNIAEVCSPILGRLGRFLFSDIRLFSPLVAIHRLPPTSLSRSISNTWYAPFRFGSLCRISKGRCIARVVSISLQTSVAKYDGFVCARYLPAVRLLGLKLHIRLLKILLKYKLGIFSSYFYYIKF